MSRASASAALKDVVATAYCMVSVSVRRRRVAVEMATVTRSGATPAIDAIVDAKTAWWARASASSIPETVCVMVTTPAVTELVGCGVDNETVGANDDDGFDVVGFDVVGVAVDGVKVGSGVDAEGRAVVGCGEGSAEGLKEGRADTEGATVGANVVVGAGDGFDVVGAGDGTLVVGTLVIVGPGDGVYVGAYVGARDGAGTSNIFGFKRAV